jgi:hypothetical protein
MDRESMKSLRLDRRLIRRRRWISAKELASELEQLPDVSHKASTGDLEAGDAPAPDVGSPDPD